MFEVFYVHMLLCGIVCRGVGCVLTLCLSRSSLSQRVSQP